MYRRPIFKWIVSCLLLSGCATTFDVRRDYDPQVNFVALHAYAWSPDRSQPSGNVIVDSDTLLRQRVEDAVDRELALKGFTKTTMDKADFWVTYRASVKRKTDVTLYNDMGGYYGYWRYPWMFGGYAGGATVRDYDEDLLTVDLLNPQNHKLLWRATASYSVNDKASPADRSRTLSELVRQLLQDFPPGAGAR